MTICPQLQISNTYIYQQNYVSHQTLQNYLSHQTHSTLNHGECSSLNININFCFVCGCQGTSDKVTKQMESQMSEANARLDEALRQVSDLESQKSKLSTECANLTRQLEESEHMVGQLSKEKSALHSSLEEAKNSLEEETRVCIINVGQGLDRIFEYL